MSVNAIAIQKDMVKAGDDLNDMICPPRQWEREHICDVSVLTYSFNIRVNNQLVETTLRYRVERCTEDYVLSDLVHSVTLFPGEEVFLSTRSRHSVARFTEDASVSASQSSRSSDRVWMEAFKSMATDFSENQSGASKASSHSEYSKTGVEGGGGVNLLFFSIGGGASHASGEFDASSSSSFFNQINQHLESSVHQTNQVTRDTMSVSLTQVNSHRVSTAEQREELEVSTRKFSNENMCHTVTHYFYQIAKRQRIKITLEGRTFRVLNRFASTAVKMKPFQMSIANNARLDFANATTPANNPNAVGIAELRDFTGQTVNTDLSMLQRVASVPYETFQREEKERQAAIQAVEKLLDGDLKEYNHESVSLVPTEALYVESELGNCIVCEPAMLAKHEYELERMRLENELLEKQISLLDKHKDYRCCDDDDPTPA